MGRRKKNPETIAAVPPTNVEKLLTEAETQIHDQQERIRRKDAIFYLVLKKMPVRVFEYDTVSDTMYYTWLNAKEEQEYRTIEHFRAYLLDRNGDDQLAGGDHHRHRHGDNEPGAQLGALTEATTQDRADARLSGVGSVDTAVGSLPCLSTRRVREAGPPVR